jgi:hypothetical protein
LEAEVYQRKQHQTQLRYRYVGAKLSLLPHLSPRSLL